MRAVMRAPSKWFFPLLPLALCFLSPLASAGFKPGPGWPEVSTPFYHAATPALAAVRIMFWHTRPGHAIQGYRDTGSMKPVLQGGRELMAMETCQPDTPLAPGQLVVFNRGDLPAVLHYIADVSRDGQHVYLSGVSSRHSDGWFPRDAVAFVVREIITVPEADPIAVAAQTTVTSPATHSTSEAAASP